MTVGDLMPRLSGRVEAGDPPPPVDAAYLNRDATAIAFDSRRVEPGAVFVAIKGQRVDGADFADEAARRGAALVVSESRARPGAEGRWVQVSDARLALAELAAAFYGDPSRDLTVVGVTGTNGKTTTTYLLAAILEAAGRSCGRIGTVTYRIGAAEVEAAHTTPEAPDVQALLREMVEHGVAACVVEVSSHALSMRRVDGTRFSAAVFTNLTRDHLDFHADMADYFEAKRRLFDMLPLGAPAVVNLDDPAGRRLAGLVGHPVTYAVEREAEVRPERVESTRAGTRLDVRTSRGRLELRSPLPGRVNAYNVLGAAAAALALDVPLPAIEQGVAALDGVPGRFEVVSSPDDDVWVMLDFAHTDDALRAVLGAVRELGAGRLISVFGCGGDRDRAKRPLMGAVAARLSDLVVLTSDNPRSEDPDLIIDQILSGVLSTAGGEGGTRHLAIVDRRAAIERAIAEAEPGDAVVVAGKGHEREQVIGDARLPFEDRAVAREALATRRARVAGGGCREEGPTA